MSDTTRRRPWIRTCPHCGQDVMIDGRGTIVPHFGRSTRVECPGSRRRYPVPRQSGTHVPLPPPPHQRRPQ